MDKGLDSAVKEAKSSGKLNLHKQGLKYFPDIFSIKTIYWIYMSNNEIYKIPDNIGNLIYLRKLQLGNNHITEIPSSISKLESLTSLNLSNNNIYEIPEEIGKLKNLTVLDLSNNSIKKLPLSFTELSNIRELDLSGNPIEFPPPEIIGRGFEAICTYINKYKDSNIKGTLLNEAKLLLVGQGGVGKTSLAKRLISDSFDDSEETTKGIAIQSISLKTDNLKGGNVKLNIWDFGGQEIYHSTHQFFLTKRSVYILVWDARQEEEYGRLDYWLRTVQAFSDNSPIMIVLNKTDERNKEINLKDIQTDFPQVAGYYKISCRDNSGIASLKSKLLNVSENLPLMETLWFDSWLEVRNILENDGRSYISYEEYLSICRRLEIKDREADTLSDYLHDLGVILHFRKDDILKNIVILKPSWETNAVYRILDYKQIYHDKGVFYKDDLYQILESNSDYPTKTYPIILKLMSNFELSFPLSNLPAHLVAELLPSVRPTYELEKRENSIRFEYKYSFMPAGVMSRFIVRCHDKLMSRGKERLYWKEGAFLCYENNYASVESITKEGRIKIIIEGNDPRDFLSVIRSHFNEIKSSFDNIEIEEYIPCKCSSSCNHLYNFDVLKRRYSKKNLFRQVRTI